METLILYPLGDNPTDKTLMAYTYCIWPGAHMRMDVGWYPDSYSRQVLTNKSWPYMEELLTVVDKLDNVDINAMVKVCEIAISLYKRPNSQCKIWQKTAKDLKDLIVQRKASFDSNNEFDLDKISKALAKGYDYHEVRGLLALCKNAITAYKTAEWNDPQPKEYYAWVGIQTQILKVIEDDKVSLKDAIRKAKADVNQAEVTLRNKVSNLTEVEEFIQILEDSTKALKLVKSDGSCDGCVHLQDTAHCKSRLHECKSGALNYIEEELDTEEYDPSNSDA